MDYTEPSKRCYVCGETKPLAEFSRHRSMTDGHINKCKACAREYSKKVMPAYRDRQRTIKAAEAAANARQCPNCGRWLPDDIRNWGIERKFSMSVSDAPFCEHCIEDVVSLSRGDVLTPSRRRQRAHQWRMKIAVLQRYSHSAKPRCVCCGESIIQFLSVDHIHGGGSRQRAELGIRGGGYPFYRWLIRQGYPSGFATLCHNCNQAKGFFGRCPHEDEHRPYTTVD